MVYDINWNIHKYSDKRECMVELFECEDKNDKLEIKFFNKFGNNSIDCEVKVNNSILYDNCIIQNPDPGNIMNFILGVFDKLNVEFFYRNDYVNTIYSIGMEVFKFFKSILDTDEEE